MKISVIIPALNEEKLIEATLQPWQAYRGATVEVILSDDGSTDHTRMLALPLVDQIVSLTGKHTTIGGCRNRGAQAATGDILWFIDSDVCLPQLAAMLHYVQQQFNEYPQLVGISFPARIYRAQERWSDRIGLGLRNWLIWVANVFGQGQSSGECQIVRRSAFMTIEGYNALLTTAEDHDLFKRLSQHGKTVFSWTYTIETSPRRFRYDGWLKVWWQWTTQWLGWFILRQPNREEWKARR